MLLCVHTRYNPFAHPSCTSLLFILLFIKPQYTVFCTSYCFALFIPLHILLLFLFFLPYICSCVVLLLYNFYFIILHCPLSGPDFTYISLLIIPCIIFYVTNKETLNLEPWTLWLKHWWQMEYPGDAFHTFLDLDSAIYLAVNGTVTNLPVLIQNNLNCVLKTNKAFTSLERHGGGVKKRPNYHFGVEYPFNAIPRSKKWNVG